MVTNEIIESINSFITSNETYKTVYDAYNAWTIKTGFVIHDAETAKWITQYLTDLLFIKKTHLSEDLFRTFSQP